MSDDDFLIINMKATWLTYRLRLWILGDHPDEPCDAHVERSLWAVWF